MQEKRNYVYSLRHVIVMSLIFIALAIAYWFYMLAQNSNVFFESQFLHYGFLKELVANKFTAKGFFSIFGEHLFPGYNLILALNYYLFDIWGGFDSLVYASFLIFTAGIVVSRVYISAPFSLVQKTLVSSAVAFFLLSVTNTPQWGMALAAAGGVLLFTLSVLFVEDALWDPDKKLSPFVFIVIPAAHLAFLGGYAIGSIAALGSLVLIHTIQNRKLSSTAVSITLTVVLSLGVYMFLVTYYGELMANKPTSIGLNIGLIIKFAILMTGASVLGKAFYESSSVLWPYYLLGSVLITLMLCAWLEFIRRPAKGRMFVLALSIYSAANVITVAFFRYRNGLDGALGQWYAVHTHFIAVAVVYWLFLKLQCRSLMTRLFCFSTIGILFYFAGVGYVVDWHKAPYSREYKERFIAQAPIIISFPELIQDKNDTSKTMLWDYESVKKTLDMMYANKLWIFKGQASIILGRTPDGWLESSQPIMIMCPLGARNLHFQIWRKDNWATAIINVRIAGREQELIVSNGDVVIELPIGAHAIMLDASNSTMAKPVSEPPDIRSLVARINDPQCQHPSQVR